MTDNVIDLTSDDDTGVNLPQNTHRTHPTHTSRAPPKQFQESLLKHLTYSRSASPAEPTKQVRSVLTNEDFVDLTGDSGDEDGRLSDSGGMAESVAKAPDSVQETDAIPDEAEEPIDTNDLTLGSEENMSSSSKTLEGGPQQLTEEQTRAIQSYTDDGTFETLCDQGGDDAEQACEDLWSASLNVSSATSIVETLCSLAAQSPASRAVVGGFSAALRGLDLLHLLDPSREFWLETLPNSKTSVLRSRNAESSGEEPVIARSKNRPITRRTEISASQPVSIVTTSEPLERRASSESMWWGGGSRAAQNPSRHSGSPASSEKSPAGKSTVLKRRQHRSVPSVEESEDGTDLKPATTRTGDALSAEREIVMDSPSSRESQGDPDESISSSPVQRGRDNQGRFISGRVSSSAEKVTVPAKQSSKMRASEPQLLAMNLQRGTFGERIQALEQNASSSHSPGPGPRQYLRSAVSESASPLRNSTPRDDGVSEKQRSGPSTPQQMTDRTLTRVVKGSSKTGSGSDHPEQPAREARGQDRRSKSPTAASVESVTATVLSLAEIEAVLEKHSKELAEDHTYCTRNYLRQARHNCVQSRIKSTDRAAANGASGVSNLPERLVEKKSPFADVKPISTVVTTQQPKESGTQSITQTVEPLVKGPKSLKPVKNTLSVPITTFAVPELHVPFFTHYNSIANNTRAENCNKLHYTPYFWDGSELDPGMNELNNHLNEGYKNLTDSRPAYIQLIHKYLKWEEYADAYLEEIGCGYKDVLRYLLRPDKDHVLPPQLSGEEAKLWTNRNPSCQEDFDRCHSKWKVVLARLPRSSSAQLAVAGIACDVFLRIAGFSLWHVARRASIVETLLKKEEESPSSDRQDPEVCPVCHLLNCQFHGMNAESESSDGEDGTENASITTSSRHASVARSDDSDSEVDGYFSSDEEDINIHLPILAPKRAGRHRRKEREKEDPLPRFNAENWISKGITNMMHKRKPFWPCDHEGACEDAKCRCWREGITCEKTCGCSIRCKRRYRGCRCAQKGKPCSNRNKCDCAALNRECDPDLCGTCGVIEVLDPVNRYDDSVLAGRCRNAFVQRDRPRHTKIGVSQVAGCGLYACEDIGVGEYISEYKGEVCCQQEGERRGVIYGFRPNNYLFTVGENLYDIDSMRYGNKTRFINNSQTFSNINVHAQLLLCNTVVRIGMFASKDIQAGEELFFNYGYSTDITRGFWEVGEAPKPKHFGEAVPPRTRRQKMKVSGARTQLTGARASASEESSPHKGRLSNSRSKNRSRLQLDEIPPDDDADIDYKPSDYLETRARLRRRGVVESSSEGEEDAATPGRRQRLARAVEETPRSKVLSAEEWSALMMQADSDDEDEMGSEEYAPFGTTTDGGSASELNEESSEVAETSDIPRGRKRKRANRS